MQRSRSWGIFLLVSTAGDGSPFQVRMGGTELGSSESLRLPHWP